MATLTVKPIRNPYTSGTMFVASVSVAGQATAVYATTSPEVALRKLCECPSLTGMRPTLLGVLDGVRNWSISDASLASGIEL